MIIPPCTKSPSNSSMHFTCVLHVYSAINSLCLIILYSGNGEVKYWRSDLDGSLTAKAIDVHCCIAFLQYFSLTEKTLIRIAPMPPSLPKQSNLFVTVLYVEDEPRQRCSTATNK